MKTFQYTKINEDKWAITDEIVIIVAKNKKEVNNFLIDAGYDPTKGPIVELTEGLHLVQTMTTE